MPDIHVPKVRITTPEATATRPFVSTVLTHIEIDGQEWPVIDYKIEGRGVSGTQSVTLTFHADVTVEHRSV